VTGPHGDEQVSLPARIRFLAAERPDEQAYWHVSPDGGVLGFTWSWLDSRSSQLAGALQERGLGFGDRLGMGLRNSPHFVLGVLAAWKLGAVPIPIRWDLPGWELERLLEVIDPRVSLTEDDVTWIDGTSEAPVIHFPDAVSPQRHGICSSGSTGTPKVILSAAPAVFDEVFSTPLAEMWQPIPRPQLILVPAPMYHVNAFAALNNLLSGDSLVVMEKFDAERAVDLIERHRITTFTATPTMLQRIADLPDIDLRDLSSLVWITQGAAPMPPSLVHRWAGFIGPEKIFMAYGMTEGLGVTALRADEWMTHEGSVGRGLRDTELRIMDETGRELPPGVVGDIYLRSGAYKGYIYLGDAARLRTTDDGFSTVGDLGYLDAEGYLYLIDRRVDMIISGGANVFPAEVEIALIDHPKIADVVVIGLKDPEWGRRVHAIIEPADPSAVPTVEEVIGYAKGRLAPYKVPKSIEIVDAMPRSAATKVNRGRLIEARGG
jgi:bile acid-coenzyme A ligase